MFLHYGIEKSPGTRLVDGSVAAVFGPRRTEFPVFSKDIVGTGSLNAGVVDPCNDQQLSQVVGPRIVDDLFIGKFVTPEFLCDAGLESAFESISGQVVGSAELPRAEEHLGFAEPSICQRLQIASVHCDDCMKERREGPENSTAPGNRGNGSFWHYSQRRKISEPLVPPKPKEFESAMCMGAFCGVLGT